MIPASPNLVPRLPEPTVGILPPPLPQYPTRNFPLGLLFAPLLALFTCPILEKFWLPKPVLGAHAI